MSALKLRTFFMPCSSGGSAADCKGFQRFLGHRSPLNLVGSGGALRCTEADCLVTDFKKRSSTCARGPEQSAHRCGGAPGQGSVILGAGLRPSWARPRSPKFRPVRFPTGPGGGALLEARLMQAEALRALQSSMCLAGQGAAKMGPGGPFWKVSGGRPPPR